MEGISEVIKLVTHKIVLSGFDIDSSNLKVLLENAHNIERLELDDCRIEVGRDFELDKSLVYKLRKLDLYRTARKYERDYLDEDKLLVLIEQFKKTTIGKTLRKVHVKQSKYGGDQLQALFDEARMDVKVYADENR